MKKTTRKHVTQEDFEAIKALQKAKLSIPQAIVVTGRSRGTVQRVYASDTYERFVARPKQAEPTPKAAPQHPEEDMQLVIAKLDQIGVCINILLEVIRDKEAKANAGFWRR